MVKSDHILRGGEPQLRVNGMIRIRSVYIGNTHEAVCNLRLSLKVALPQNEATHSRLSSICKLMSTSWAG